MKPHLWIAEEKQVKVLWLLLIALVIVGGVLGKLSPPGGWLSLEFPVFADISVDNSPGSWNPRERDAALFALGLDFLFLIIYPLFLAILCGRAGLNWNLSAGLARWSLFFSGLVVLAAPLDVLENIGLYLLIRGSTSDALQWSISLVAALKWFIALAATLIASCCIANKLWRDRSTT